MAHQQTVRNPPPRMLTVSETLYSLNHWKTSFRTYYRRDSFYKGFLLPQAQWDPALPNYGQVNDVSGDVVVRTAEDKGEDLQDFLHTLVGYLPFPYLTEKEVHGTKNLKEVWDTLYEHYGLSITGETLLDYADLSMITGQEIQTLKQSFY